MQQFKAAMQDQDFVAYQHSKYDQILEATEKLKKDAENMQDVDIQEHLRLLEKHHLKVDDWQLKRNLMENDFVDYLKEGFCTDLKDRHIHSKQRNSPFPA